jgi:hypothetical protein
VGLDEATVERENPPGPSPEVRFEGVSVGRLEFMATPRIPTS